MFWLLRFGGALYSTESTLLTANTLFDSSLFDGSTIFDGKRCGDGSERWPRQASGRRQLQLWHACMTDI
jgi:hypothetical protein